MACRVAACNSAQQVACLGHGSLELIHRRSPCSSFLSQTLRLRRQRGATIMVPHDGHCFVPQRAAEEAELLNARYSCGPCVSESAAARYGTSYRNVWWGLGYCFHVTRLPRHVAAELPSSSTALVPSRALHLWYRTTFQKDNARSQALGRPDRDSTHVPQKPPGLV